MPRPHKTISIALSETEREALRAFLRLSSRQVSAETYEQKVLTSLAFALRRTKIAN